MVCLLATLAQPIRDKLAFLPCRPPDPIAHSDAALVLLRQANGVLCFTRVSLNDGVGVSWRVGRGARAVIALMSADAMGPALPFVRGAGQPLESCPATLPISRRVVCLSALHIIGWQAPSRVCSNARYAWQRKRLLNKWCNGLWFTL